MLFIKELLERVFEKTQEAVLRMLGYIYAGSGGNVNNGIVKEEVEKQKGGGINRCNYGIFMKYMI